jgi:hypothetical protein
MKENKFLSVVAGAIIGFLLGSSFYLFPTKMLFSGPVVGNELFLPPGMQEMLLVLSATYGGTIGAVIGMLGGLTMRATLPRGQMSKSISCVCAIICPIVAFIQHGHFLAKMSGGRIALTFLVVVIAIFLAIPMGHMIGFIERIRERS